MVCGHLTVLCRLHHLPDSRERDYSERQAETLATNLHARLVRSHNLDARDEKFLVFYALPIPRRCYRGPIPSSRLPHDQFLVHEGGIATANGYLARRKHHLECHFWYLGGRNPHEHGQCRGYARLAMVLHHRGNGVDLGCRPGILVPAQLAE